MAWEGPKYVSYQIADLQPITVVVSKSAIRLQTYSREPITVVGSTDVQLFIKARPLQVVVKGDGPTLLGRNWLRSN